MRLPLELVLRHREHYTTNAKLLAQLLVALSSKHWGGCAFWTIMPWARSPLHNPLACPLAFGTLAPSTQCCRYQIMWYLVPLCSNLVPLCSKAGDDDLAWCAFEWTEAGCVLSNVRGGWHEIWPDKVGRNYAVILLQPGPETHPHLNFEHDGHFPWYSFTAKIVSLKTTDEAKFKTADHSNRS